MSLFSFQDIITATTGILILLALVLALSVIIQGAESEIEVVYADDNLLAQRELLIAEVDNMKQLSAELAKESMTWSSATPEDLQTKITTSLENIDFVKNQIQQAESRLAKQHSELANMEKNSTAVEVNAKLNQTEETIAALKSELKNLKANDRIVYNFRNITKGAWLVEISKAKIVSAKVGTSGPPISFNSPQAFNKFATNVQQSDQYFILLIKPSGIANYDLIKAYLAQQNADVGVELIGENQVVIDPVKGASF